MGICTFGTSPLKDIAAGFGRVGMERCVGKNSGMGSEAGCTLTVEVMVDIVEGIDLGKGFLMQDTDFLMHYTAEGSFLEVGHLLTGTDWLEGLAGSGEDTIAEYWVISEVTVMNKAMT